MAYLNIFDYSVMGVYFLALLGLGLYLRKRASESIENYFIGGRTMPWWALGISGMASWLDITGTMIILSFIFMLGPRAMFIEGFRGAAGLVLVVAMLWTGKYHRRSGCLTLAEWMTYRFGDNLSGRCAQFLQVLAGIVLSVGLLGYLIKGAGLFLSTFMPFSPMMCATILIGIATLYTMMSGFYGVVFIDVFQAGIIFITVVFIVIIAVMGMGEVGDFGALTAQVTGNSQWMSSFPSWHTEMPKGYESYQFLFMLGLLYLFKELFRGTASGGDPKYFGAKSDRECGTLSFIWGWALMIRWPLVMGFGILGIILVSTLFPDQAVLVDCAAAIKSYFPEVNKAGWETLTSGIIYNPGAYPAELIAELKTILGEDWLRKMLLVSYEGTVNSERVLPAVLLFKVPAAMRGLVLVGLIAAGMSTFDSMINATTGFITRDIYQKYLRPKANTKELIYASWGGVAGIVLCGYLMAFSAKSINDIWGWIMMGLSGGILVPTILRLYWWRFNGWGFASSMAGGLIAAVLQRIFMPDMHELMQLVMVIIIGTFGAILGTCLSRPTDWDILTRFYRQTRPLGLWGPVKKEMNEAEIRSIQKEHKYDLISLPFTLLWIVTLFLLPMQLMIKAYESAVYSGALLVISLTGLYFFWYKHLPAGNHADEIEEEISELEAPAVCSEEI